MADTVETKPEEQESKPPVPSKGSPGLWTALGAGVLCLAALLWSLATRPAEPAADSASTGDVSAVVDTVPPQLLGVQDLTVAMGGTVSYRDGVSALDDVDGEISFQVEAGGVDLNVPGEYPVIYSVQDAAGNRTEATATVTVIETLTVDQDIEEPDEEEPSSSANGGGGSAISLDQITQEDVDQLSDKILARITNSSMSQREKAKAIFDYVNKHVKYVGTSDKSSWIIGAYVGFTRGRGDCYNYFACSKALLTRAGIPNVDLHRVGGTSRHYWQLVNTGDGWYHFDACPHPNGYPLYSFMMTETQVRAYTEQARASRKNYYVYDYDACPVRAVGMPEEVQPPAEENPDSSQEIPDVSQVPENPDGSQVNPDGSQANPDSSQVNSDGSQANPDGSQANPDGSQVNPDGSQENPDDSQEQPDDSTENPDGSQGNPDDSQQPDNPDASQQNPPEEGENQLAA